MLHYCCLAPWPWPATTVNVNTDQEWNQAGVSDFTKPLQLLHQRATPGIEGKEPGLQCGWGVDGSLNLC